MIFIISNEDDISTDKVLRYLSINKSNFFRFNLTLAIIERKLNIEINKNGFVIELYNYVITDKDIDNNVFWFRRDSPISEHINKFNCDKDLLDITYSELTAMKEAFFGLLKNFHWLGLGHVNKIEMLFLAQKTGLAIPCSLITGQKETLKHFSLLHKDIICKTIGNGFRLNYHNTEYLISPHIMDNIDTLPQSFIPSLVQDYKEKEFDVRVFYINKRCFTSAIFSQDFEESKIDFRINPSMKNNVRISPIKLPANIECKLSKMMSLANLNMGTIDLVYQKGKFIFLEVNPQGQFGGYANVCGFNLYQIIAEELISISHGKK